MKPIIIYNDIILKRLSWFMQIKGIFLWPFIILRSNYKKHPNDTLLNHEKIHFHQGIETGVFFFYLFYLIEFIIKLILTKSLKKGYLSISFEQESYANETNINYLSSRNRHNWCQYLFTIKG